MGKKIAIVAICLVVIGACVWLMLPKGGGVPPERLLQSHVCEACDHAYTAAAGADAALCPKCQKRAGVRVHRYTCGGCGETFEAFRERELGEPGQPPRLEYKRPGGTWTASSESLGDIVCPTCKGAEVTPAKAEPAGS